MKISEFIEKLNNLKDKHGDIEVCIYTNQIIRKDGVDFDNDILFASFVHSPLSDKVTKIMLCDTQTVQELIETID